MVEISTKTKKNLDKLIESIVLQAETLDLKTDYESKANGIVLADGKQIYSAESLKVGLFK